MLLNDSKVQPLKIQDREQCSLGLEGKQCLKQEIPPKPHEQNENSEKASQVHGEGDQNCMRYTGGKSELQEKDYLSHSLKNGLEGGHTRGAIKAVPSNSNDILSQDKSGGNECSEKIQRNFV